MPRSLASRLDGAAQTRSLADALKSLDAAETEAAGTLQTATLKQSLEATLSKLSSTDAKGGEQSALIVEALAKARDLASRVGDDSNLALDPDLDSYYLQDTVVRQIPRLLGEIGDTQTLLGAACLNSSRQQGTRQSSRCHYAVDDRGD